MSLRIRIREALPIDKEPVLKFCRDTWPRGDYIQDVWDDWILNRNGRFIVATKDRVPVGIAHRAFRPETWCGWKGCGSVRTLEDLESPAG